jgi:hypothetical protein
VAAAAGWSLVLGNIVIFHAVMFSTHPAPPAWQAIGAGLVLGLFIMPFFFMTVSRAMPLLSPWEAVATLSAASVTPLIMWRLGALGLHWLVLLACCIGLVVAAFFIGRAIETWKR